FDEGYLARLPTLAAELVRLKVDVIIAAGGTPAILAAKNATSTIPIIFPTVGDPVAQGIVASFARPGGNITGLTIMTPEIGSKKLELLKQVVPRAMRVAVLGQEANVFTALDFKNLRAPALAMGLQLHHIEVRSSDDFESAFSKITSTVRATALFLQAVGLFVDSRGQIADLAAKNRVPAIPRFRANTQAGLLMSYGADRTDLGRRAAFYVDKILKGAKPADLPVEQPTKFELVINLKTVALGKARERRIRDESVKLLKEVQPVKFRPGQSLAGRPAASVAFRRATGGGEAYTARKQAARGQLRHLI